jgi:hypothetical protein
MAPCLYLTRQTQDEGPACSGRPPDQPSSSVPAATFFGIGHAANNNRSPGSFIIISGQLTVWIENVWAWADGRVRLERGNINSVQEFRGAIEKVF